MNPPPRNAPRAAYLLTAAVADNAAQVGAIVPGDDVSAEWVGYDKTTQLEILAALGIAKAMCSLQIQAYFRLGFTPAMIAAMCRRPVAVETSSPRH